MDEREIRSINSGAVRYTSKYIPVPVYPFLKSEKIDWRIGIGEL